MRQVTKCPRVRCPCPVWSDRWPIEPSLAKSVLKQVVVAHWRARQLRFGRKEEEEGGSEWQHMPDELRQFTAGRGKWAPFCRQQWRGTSARGGSRQAGSQAGRKELSLCHQFAWREGGEQTFGGSGRRRCRHSGHDDYKRGGGGGTLQSALSRALVFHSRAVWSSVGLMEKSARIDLSSDLCSRSLFLAQLNRTNLSFVSRLLFAVAVF